MKFKIQVCRCVSFGRNLVEERGVCKGHTDVADSAVCDSAEISDFLRNRKMTMALIIDRLSPP